ncbi:AMP-binding protein [Acinetobacter sp. WZC-1]|uniref:AMP-binding protein n=1 Tax=Acinetobacter sp. WZC-1 TaxID=3459034 RepID=UPI00403D6861
MQKDSNQDLLKIDSKNINLENYLQKIYENISGGNSNKTALIFNGQHISYAEVGKNVIKIAAAFKKQDLRIGSVVAICLRKSPEHIYTALACALTGMIWLPIDMDSPPSRLNYLLSNSRADIVVSDSFVAGILNLNINEALFNAMACEPDWGYEINRAPAYYLYTSGSTGMPKCVVLNNQATANVLSHTIAEWKLGSDDVVMAITPFHHDMSVFDVFATMAVGATLIVPSFEQSKNAVVWAELLDRYKVTIWSSVPAIVDMLVSVARTEQLQSLRLIAQGGDYVKPSLISRLRQQLQNARLFSLGGPTETTIWSIWHEIGDEDQDVIPYGKALKNNQYFILNENMQPCQIGEVGTMYMAGINLSNGYLRDGEIDYQDFIEIQVNENERQTAFRMSDQGYFRPDQNIIFAGREDGYLKIKGVRISAAEVENTLSKNPNIHHCVVVGCTHPTTETQELVAIYTIVDRDNTAELNGLELKRFLKAHLPDSHIPSRYLAVDLIPLTRNGKIDRKTLQTTAQDQIYAAYVKTESTFHEVGNSVLMIFREYISENKDENIDIFYRSEILDMGIRPKQLMSIAQKISQRLDIKIDFYTLISCKTVQDVVNQVQQKINP